MTPTLTYGVSKFKNSAGNIGQTFCAWIEVIRKLIINGQNWDSNPVNVKSTRVQKLNVAIV